MARPGLITYGKAVGVVPSDVTGVTFTLTDGSTKVVEPQDGIYSAPADASSVAFGTGSQQANIELMPSSREPADVTSLPGL
jgi:hypothetical protein